MEKTNISENLVKNTFISILNEEMGKVKREDFNRVQFKIDELQNSMNETIRELRKLQDSIPSGLKTALNGRITNVASNLSVAQKTILQLKEKIRQYKRAQYAQNIEEKKK